MTSHWFTLPARLLISRLLQKFFDNSSNKLPNPVKMISSFKGFLALVNDNSYIFSKEFLVNGSLFVGDINSYGNGFSTTFHGLTITNNGLIVVDSRNLTTGSMIVSWGGSSMIGECISMVWIAVLIVSR